MPKMCIVEGFLKGGMTFEEHTIESVKQILTYNAGIPMSMMKCCAR